ncbi:hypothetical protein NI18_00190 [Sphingomonas sp. Ant20]|nr:hypothetical protein NI18_00190 [Sphingomonas sp. Ant20]
MFIAASKVGLPAAPGPVNESGVLATLRSAAFFSRTALRMAMMLLIDMLLTIASVGGDRSGTVATHKLEIG